MPLNGVVSTTLPEEPASTRVSGALTRHVWRKASGEAIIEVNMIAGMGHGTPLAADLGTAGPFMLDVGIPSTREIAAFWGVANMEGICAPRHRNTHRQRPGPSHGPAW